MEKAQTFSFAWRSHAAYTLTIAIEGVGRRFIGDSIARYEPGDLVLVGPNVPQCWQAADRGERDPHELFVVHFMETFVGQGFFGQPEMHHLRDLLDRSLGGVEVLPPARSGIRTALLSIESVAAWPRILRLLEVLDGIATSPDTKPILETSTFSPGLGPAPARRLERVCAFIAEHYRRRLPQPEAAAVAGMSVPSFSRFFKRATQRTFTSYVNELRIGYACHRLIETELPIAAVAKDAGFDNLSNFNRRFRQIKRVSPREFRRAHRASPPADPAHAGSV